jgi:hypothetical protein
MDGLQNHMKWIWQRDFSNIEHEDSHFEKEHVTGSEGSVGLLFVCVVQIEELFVICEFPESSTGKNSFNMIELKWMYMIPLADSKVILSYQNHQNSLGDRLGIPIIVESSYWRYKYAFWGRFVNIVSLSKRSCIYHKGAKMISTTRLHVVCGL